MIRARAVRRTGVEMPAHFKKRGRFHGEDGKLATAATI